MKKINTYDDFEKYVQEEGYSSYTAIFGWQNRLDDTIDTMDLIEFGYITSYKDSADILVEQQTPDLMMFPVIFLYRQYLELLLKNILRCSMEENDYNRAINRLSHDIKGIWDDYVKNIIKNSELNICENDLNFIQYVVNFFDKIDPKSFSYRYPTQKNGKNSIGLDKDIFFNLKNIKKSIDRIDYLLYATYN